MIVAAPAAQISLDRAAHAATIMEQAGLSRAERQPALLSAAFDFAFDLVAVGRSTLV
jgi:hypothetical protein